ASRQTGAAPAPAAPRRRGARRHLPLRRRALRPRGRDGAEPAGQRAARLADLSHRPPTCASRATARDDRRSLARTQANQRRETMPDQTILMPRRSFFTGAGRATLSAGAVLLLAGCGSRQAAMAADPSADVNI